MAIFAKGHKKAGGCQKGTPNKSTAEIKVLAQDYSEMALMAIDTTGSTVTPVGKGLEPLDDCYLWCDHRARQEAALITREANKPDLKPSNGAAEPTPASGASLNYCIGFVTIQRNATTSQLPWSTATWWQSYCAA
jgi:hypothetical protein